MQIVSKIEGGGTKAVTIDEKSLETQLQAAIEGEVRFDGGTRALYATAARNYRQVPIGVVLPKTNRDVVEAVAICRRYGAPILMRGGGTSLAGQTCNVAIVLDISKYLRGIVKLDPESKSATAR